MKGGEGERLEKTEGAGRLRKRGSRILGELRGLKGWGGLEERVEDSWGAKRLRGVKERGSRILRALRGSRGSRGQLGWALSWAPCEPLGALRRPGRAGR